MNVPFNSAALDGGSEIPRPNTGAGPGPSRAATASSANDDHGRDAPTSAHAMPSREMCADRAKTSFGTSAKEVRARKLASFLVAPSAPLETDAASTPAIYSPKLRPSSRAAVQRASSREDRD